MNAYQTYIKWGTLFALGITPQDARDRARPEVKLALSDVNHQRPPKTKEEFQSFLDKELI